MDSHDLHTRGEEPRPVLLPDCATVHDGRVSGVRERFQRVGGLKLAQLGAHEPLPVHESLLGQRQRLLPLVQLGGLLLQLGRGEVGVGSLGGPLRAPGDGGVAGGRGGGRLGRGRVAAVGV